MKKRNIAARICAVLLAASLIAADASPAFATEAAGEQAAGHRQAMEDGFAGEAAAQNEDTDAENTAGEETPGTEEETPKTLELERPGAADPAELDLPDGAGSETADPAELDLPDGAGSETADPADPEAGLPDGTGRRPELFDGAVPREGQETPSGIQQKEDGTIYQDGVPYNGYYMDNAGALYSVADGQPTPETGTVAAGTQYYNCQTAKMEALQSKAMYMEGKAYTGYYIDTDGILYQAANGLAEPKTGIVSTGTQYYNCQTAKIMAFQGLAVYVAGKAYTGYYMDADGILYQAANGLVEPQTGTVAAGAEYYSSQAAKIMAFQSLTVYVGGKVYSGYYTDHENKMYHSSKGAPALKTGLMKAGTAYYSFNEKKSLSLTKQALYVEGKVYSGYYMDSSKKMYSVTKGTRTLKTGSVKAGAKYYSFNEKKTLTLAKKTLYVKGKVYTGYYMDSSKKMYYAKKGTASLKTGSVKAGAKYYNYSSKKTLKLSKKTLYVKGKAYTGYYMDSSKKMYYAKKGTASLKTGSVKAGAKYYSYKSKKTLKLSKKTLYVKGKAYTGYYMDSSQKMYRANKGTCTLTTGILEAGTKYYSYKSKKTLTLQGQTLYVEGKVYTGYYMDAENKMHLLSGGASTPVNAALDAGTAYYSTQEGKMLSLPAQTVYVNGKEMAGMSPESLATLQRAQAVVARITNDSMSREQKLRACFEYVKTAYREINPRIPHYKGMDWPVVYANDMFVNGAGNCCSYAAAFAYMAKAIGCEEVYCCNSGGHGWAEIDGLVYDPEWSKWHHAYNYFALSYNTPTDQDYKGAIGAGHPWMRIKI